MRRHSHQRSDELNRRLELNRRSVFIVDTYMTVDTIDKYMYVYSFVYIYSYIYDHIYIMIILYIRYLNLYICYSKFKSTRSQSQTRVSYNKRRATKRRGALAYINTTSAINIEHRSSPLAASCSAHDARSV